MKYLKNYENFVYEDNENTEVPANTDTKTDGNLTPEKVNELSDSFKSSKEITFKFNKPIGGLNSITFIKKEGKMVPRIKESKIALIKAAKTVWNDLKQYINDIIKLVAEKIKIGFDTIKSYVEKVFGMKESELQTANEDLNWLDGIAIVCCVLGIALMIVAIVNGGIIATSAIAMVKVAIGLDVAAKTVLIGQVAGILFGAGVVAGVASTIVNKLKK